jgi:hypothetical protein
VHRGDVPVRQRPGDRHRLPGRDQRRAFQRGLDQADGLLAQPGQVGQGLVPHRAAVAPGAAQVGRLVFAAAALLVGVAAANPGHVHRSRLPCHTPIISCYALEVIIISSFFWLHDEVGWILCCAGQGTEVLQGVTGTSA